MQASTTHLILKTKFQLGENAAFYGVRVAVIFGRIMGVMTTETTAKDGRMDTPGNYVTISQKRKVAEACQRRTFPVVIVCVGVGIYVSTPFSTRTNTHSD